MAASPDTKGKIRIGTRGSRLARWQSDWVAQRLRALHPGLKVDLVEIRTLGDRDRNSPLAAIGGVLLYWDTLKSYYEKWTRPTTA